VNQGSAAALPPAQLLAALLVAVLAIAGCSGDPSGAGEPTRGGGAAGKAERSLRVPEVSVATVEARAVERTVDATGSLLAWEEAVVNTSVPGTVARLLVDLGDRVGAGQIVAEQDQRELALGVAQADAGARAARDALERSRAQATALRAQLDQVRSSRRSLEANLNRSRAELAEARAHLERTRKLVEEALVAQRDLDVAISHFEAALALYQTAQVELAQFPDRVRVAEANMESEHSAVRVAEADLQRREAELALARKRLADLTLRAPITGAIARRHLNPGQYVPENTAVYTIVRSDPLKFTGTVAEHAALEVRPGQPVRIRVEPVPGRRFVGRVTRVSPAVDTTSRTVQIEAEVGNADRLLKAGLFVRAAVVLREDRDVPFVPEGAVSHFAGLTKVFVVADGTARERPVALGVRTDGLVEIVRGVRPGEQVATSGLAQLQDGAAVKAVPGRGRRPAGPA